MLCHPESSSTPPERQLRTLNREEPGYLQGTRQGLAPGWQGCRSEDRQSSNGRFEQRRPLSVPSVVSSSATPSRGPTLTAPHEH